MTTAYSVLRQNLMKLLHVSRMVTATSQGGAAGATYISTDLQKWDGASDDHYNGQWIITTSGATQESRFVSDYATATGTITPRPVFSAQIANLVTAEVLPWEPDLVLDAFKRAVRQAYPRPLSGRKGLFVTLYEELIANSWIWNGHFEDFTLTTIPDHFAKVGTATVSAETTIQRGGLSNNTSVKMTGGGATDYIYQSNVEVPGLLDLQNSSPTFRVWAYASAASKARLTIAYKVASDTSLTTTSSSYHTGNSEFELLEKQVTLPADITDLQVRLESGGGTVYFDNLYSEGGPYLFKYHMSKDFVHDPIVIQGQVNDDADSIQGGEVWETVPRGMWHVEDDGTNRILVIRPVTEGCFTPYLSLYRKKMRIVGNETLTVPTTDASTVEVDNEQMDTLVTLAAAELMSSIEGSTLPDDQIIDYKGRAARWRMEGERMLSLYGKPFPMQSGRV